MSLIIFSSLNSVLLETNNGDRNTARPVLEKLRSQNIPLVLVSNHTRAALEAWQTSLGLNCPLIVEYGSGIFLPKNGNFNLAETTTEGNYHLKQLGCTYTEARAALKAIQEDINKILRGFGDLDDTDIQELANISLDGAKKAKAREFSEIFPTPSRIPTVHLEQAAVEYGFKVLPGDTLSCVVGENASNKTAIEWLIQNYQPTSPSEKIMTVGLGIEPEDLELLETVNLPITTPEATEADSFAGWLEALEQAISK